MQERIKRSPIDAVTGGRLSLKESEQKETWFEKFANYDLDSLPTEGIRQKFRYLLQYRAGILEFNDQINDNDFERNIGEEGDSPRREIIHEIGNSRMRRQLLNDGEIPVWDYAKVHPDAQLILEGMSREELVRQFGEETRLTFELYTNPEVAERLVQPPKAPKKISAESVLELDLLHDARHHAFTIVWRRLFKLPSASQKVLGG